MEKTISDKSQNCEIVGVFGELQVVGCGWSRQKGSGAWCWRGVSVWLLVEIFIKRTEMAYHKNKVGK